MFKIESGFMGEFKLGDNINYNLKILKRLYIYSNSDKEEAHFLYKPIILIIVSIIEALLADFFFKINEYTQEGVGDINKETLSDIRNKKLNRLDQYITAIEKHKLLDLDKNSYIGLDELRKLRNRIHIRNQKKDFEENEEHAFSKERKELAEKLLEEIMKEMERRYDRGHKYVEDFILPWNSHYPN